MYRAIRNRFYPFIEGDELQKLYIKAWRKSAILNTAMCILIIALYYFDVNSFSGFPDFFKKERPNIIFICAVFSFFASLIFGFLTIKLNKGLLKDSDFIPIPIGKEFVFLVQVFFEYLYIFSIAILINLFFVGFGEVIRLYVAFSIISAMFLSFLNGRNAFYFANFYSVSSLLLRDWAREKR